MTEKVVTAREPLAFSEALDVLKRSKVGKLLILDSSDRLVSMVTRSDLKKVRDFPEIGDGGRGGALRVMFVWL